MGDDPRAPSAADEFADPFVAPFMNIAERAFQDFTLGGINPWLFKTMTTGACRYRTAVQFRSGHLKRPVSDQDDGPEGWIGEPGPDGGRDGEAHGGVVGRRQKLKPPVDEDRRRRTATLPRRR